MVFTTERFLEVATEGWHEWNLNPQPLNYVPRLYDARNAIRLRFKLC